MNRPEPLRILLVEDSTTQAHFVEQTLWNMDPPPSEVVWVESLAGALAHPDGAADLVLLDLVLPDSEGIETFRSVLGAHPGVPIIVLSGSGDEGLALQAVAEGAQDYLFKNSVSPETLARAIRFSMERHRTVKALRAAALLDGLTGLYNRRGFTTLAEHHVAMARRTATRVSVLFVDVDGLKHVNDTFGHGNGDLLLADLAQLMKTAFRSGDVLGRVGGDEFCALLLGEEASATTIRLRQAIHEYNAAATRPFRLSCSIGVVTMDPADGLALTELLTQADRAMYEEKRIVRGTRSGLGGSTGL